MATRIMAKMDSEKGMEVSTLRMIEQQSKELTKRNGNPPRGRVVEETEPEVDPVS
jgi:hypothetical protein